MALQANDFVEIEYTGKVKDSGQVFDTTSEEKAAQAGIKNTRLHYGPVIICLGQGQILKGLDDQLIGKETGKEYTFCLPPETAFGKKDAKLLKIVPANVFLKQGIRPVPGLQVNIDTAIGTVRTVTGGRTIVDFNHPLSGHEVEYVVLVKRQVTDKKEQVLGLLGFEAHMHDIAVTVKEGCVIVSVKALPPEPLMQHLSNRIKQLTDLAATFVRKEEKPQPGKDEINPEKK